MGWTGELEEEGGGGLDDAPPRLGGHAGPTPHPSRWECHTFDGWSDGSTAVWLGGCKHHFCGETIQGETFGVVSPLNLAPA